MNLCTFGVPELRGDAAVPAPLFGTGKPLALLTYLAAAPSRTASRSSLVSLLWSDLEADDAKHALRQTIWYLRRKTGLDLVVAAGDTLQLAADVTVDRDAFLAASSAGDHERVVALYTGPFIPTFAAPGGSRFEDWCALERRRLLEVFRHSAEALVRARLLQGRARDAVDLARRLRDEDLYNESGWRLLIEVCTSANDLLTARAEAEALHQLAEREELELEPATRAMVRAVRARALGTRPEGDEPHTAAPTLSGSLVGREAPFAALLLAWEQVRDGRMTRVHVTARPGIGKTRLLRDFAARLRGMRAKVILPAATQGTRDIAYATAGDLAAGLAALPGKRSLAPESAATLVALNPSLSTYFETGPRHTGPDDVMRARTIALRELAAAVSFEHPVAILLDDVHWCDDESSTLLNAFVDGLRDARILLLTTGRPEARLAPLVTDDKTRHVELTALNVAQVEELVLSIASLPPSPWAAGFAPELWRASRGSPLLALEMLQLLEGRGLLRRDQGAWHTDAPDALTAELRGGDVLQQRLQDMDARDRWLLVLLSVSGAPLDTAALVEAAEGDGPNITERLRHLEGRGLVMREGGSWRIGHDEIAEELLRLTDPGGLSRAGTRVGRALLTAGRYTEARARRAAQLLRIGDDPRSRAELFRRFALDRHAQGDRSSLLAVAADLLGAGATAAEVRALRNSAPWTWRLGLVTRARRLAAAGLSVVLLAGLMGLRSLLTRGTPDAVLGIALVDAVGKVRLESVELHSDDWNPQDPLTPRPWTGPGPTSLASTNAFRLAWNARQGTLVTAQSMDDDGVIELFEYRAGAPSRRLAPSPGDDQSHSISPDGTRMVFVTARWDTLSHYDLALYGLRDSSIKQLTSGAASDGSPVWSPGGGRIAFSRANWGAGPDEVCVLDLATIDARCVPAASVGPLGWVDEDRIAVVEPDGESHRLRVLQWSTGEVTTIAEGLMPPISMSGDGRWVFCRCSTTPGGEARPAIFPLTTPGLIREVSLPDTSATTFSPFWIASTTPNVAGRVRIRLPVPRVVAGVPTTLAAAILDRDGRELSFHGRLQWSLANPASGQIDPSTGVLVATGATPSILVRVQSGSAIADSVILRVSGEGGRVAFDEDWRGGADARWIFYGKPVPEVVPWVEGGNAFLNNGDGSFASGALSRAALPTTAGVALEARVSTPVTRPQWQVLRFGLRQRADTSRYLRARDRNVTPPGEAADEPCGAGYPTEGSSAAGGRRLTLGAGRRSAAFPLDESLLSGTVHTIRLQLLPDGRCGLAIDGTPLGILAASPRVDATVRAFVEGNSRSTRMLVGQVRAYQGVPADIDWRRAPTVPRPAPPFPTPHRDP